MLDGRTNIINRNVMNMLTSTRKESSINLEKVITDSKSIENDIKSIVMTININRTSIETLSSDIKKLEAKMKEISINIAIFVKSAMLKAEVEEANIKKINILAVTLEDFASAFKNIESKFINSDITFSCDKAESAVMIIREMIISGEKVLSKYRNVYIHECVYDQNSEVFQTSLKSYRYAINNSKRLLALIKNRSEIKK